MGELGDWRNREWPAEGRPGGGAALSFVLTGSAKTGDSGSFVGIVAQGHLGIMQGEANTLNGVGDAGVGLINLGAKVVNLVAQRRVFSDENGSIDWSRNMFVFEGETAHNLSKFLGGNGLITLVTAGAGAAGAGARAAGSGAEAVQVFRAILLADGRLALVPLTASAGTTQTTVTVAALASAAGQTAQMSVAGGSPPGGGGDPSNPLQAAMDRGMKVLRGPSAPDEMVEVTKRLGRPMSREQIGEVIHNAKDKMNIGPAEDLVFDRSGGMWDSRTGEYIGKIWEPL